MKRLLILPRERYKSPTSKNRSSRHIKGSTRLVPMDQYGTAHLNNQKNVNQNLNKLDSNNHKDSHNSSFDSNLHKIQPIIIPPKEKAAELTGKRLEFHKIAIKNICACELEGIINYTLECLSELNTAHISPKVYLKNDDNSMNINDILDRNKPKFIKGEFTPKSIDSICHSENGDKKTILGAFHTIDSQNFLHFTSEHIFKSLSHIFNVEISENHISDPNPILNSMISEYQNQMIPFLSPYYPYKQIPFPFIIGIGGPPSNGKTTVCQFLQKTFLAHVIHVKFTPIEKSKIDKKPPTSLKKTVDKLSTKNVEDTVKDSMMITELVLQSNSTEEEEIDEAEKQLPYYPLPNAYEITYSDDKSAVNSIVTLIQNILTEKVENENENSNEKGFIIDGFPNNMNQYKLLEKTLTSKNINMHENQINHMLIPPSQRQRAAMTSLDGVIITCSSMDDNKNKDTMRSNNLKPKKRLIDPESGNVYSPHFHMPGLADLIGISPPFFAEKKNEIELRLEELPLDEEVSQKVVSKYIQFESSLRKANSSTLLITACQNSFELLEKLDEFVLKLFKNVQSLIPSLDSSSSRKDNQPDYNKEVCRIKPMVTLLNPTSLIQPELTFTAMSAWSQCIETFGKPISDQSQLVTSLSEKVESLQKVAGERFQLLVAQKDDRKEICEKFIEGIKNKLNIVTKSDDKDKENVSMTNSILQITSPNKNTKTKKNPRFKTNIFIKESQNSNDGQLNDNKIDMKDFNEYISDHFKNIWDLSIAIRAKNLLFVDDIINKCGLIELILEFRKSPKKYFIFLVHRMIYVKWFFDTFSYIHKYEVNDQERSSFFDDLNLRTTTIPQVNFQLSTPPANIKVFKSMFTLDPPDIKCNPNPEKSHRPNNDSNSQKTNNPESTNSSKISNMKSYVSNKQPILSSISDDMSDSIEPQSSRPIYKSQNKESDDRHYLAEIRGFQYLEENLKSFSKRPDDEIYFDSAGACNSLGILKFSPPSGVTFEKDTAKYAEEFFNHVFVSFDGQGETEYDLNSLLANEAKIGLKFFRKFATACRRKEASIVNSVFDLQDSLKMYANSKTTREMEKFSKRFRSMKSVLLNFAGRINEQYEIIQKAEEEITVNSNSKSHKKFNASKENSMRIEKVFDHSSLFSCEEISYLSNLNASDLFEYDVDLISEDVRHLADLSLSLNPPFFMQSLVPFEDVLSVAEECTSVSLIYANVDEFMKAVKDAVRDEYVQLKLELCLRVAECVESFDVKQFLNLFARNGSDELELIEIFKKPPKPQKNLLFDSLSTFVKGLTNTKAALSIAAGKNNNYDDDVNEEEEEEEEENEDDIETDNSDANE